jgi:RNA polymerase sigma-70 factor, ECF subfamily
VEKNLVGGSEKERHLEDRELIRKLLAKDEEAQRHFFHAYRDRLYKACVYILGYKDAEADDVVQETYIAAFNQLDKFEFKSSLSSWLIRICMNLCHERIRQRMRQIVRIEGELEGLSGPMSMEVERRQEEHSRKQKMMELIETQRKILGDPCRGLLQLRDEEDKSYAEIAETVKIPIGTVMSRLARCKEALKQLVFQALKKEEAHA